MPADASLLRHQPLIRALAIMLRADIYALFSMRRYRRHAALRRSVRARCGAYHTDAFIDASQVISRCTRQTTVSHTSADYQQYIIVLAACAPYAASVTPLFAMILRALFAYAPIRCAAPLQEFSRRDTLRASYDIIICHDISYRYATTLLKPVQRL